jgi:predicted transcriptional regulator
MARPKRVGNDLTSISAERARLEAQLAELAAREKEALEIARDAGRTVLIQALEKIKIAEMNRQDARAIAQAIAKLGGAEVARLVQTTTKR